MLIMHDKLSMVAWYSMTVFMKPSFQSDIRSTATTQSTGPQQSVLLGW